MNALQPTVVIPPAAVTTAPMVVKEIKPPVPLSVPAAAVVAAVPIASGGIVTGSPVLIGPNGRRLSQGRFSI